MRVRQRENAKVGSVPRNRGREHNPHRRPFSGRHGSGLDPRIGSTDTTAFELYVEQVLAPSLQAGQIVMMDNLQARHVRTRQAGYRS
jgi:hypothetical protein